MWFHSSFYSALLTKKWQFRGGVQNYKVMSRVMALTATRPNTVICVLRSTVNKLSTLRPRSGNDLSTALPFCPLPSECAIVLIFRLNCPDSCFIDAAGRSRYANAKLTPTQGDRKLTYSLNSILPQNLTTPYVAKVTMAVAELINAGSATFPNAFSNILDSTCSSRYDF